jgi:hypothetical protein
LGSLNFDGSLVGEVALLVHEATALSFLDGIGER